MVAGAYRANFLQTALISFGFLWFLPSAALWRLAVSLLLRSVVRSKPNSLSKGPQVCEWGTGCGNGTNVIGVGGTLVGFFFEGLVIRGRGSPNPQIMGIGGEGGGRNGVPDANGRWVGVLKGVCPSVRDYQFSLLSFGVGFWDLISGLEVDKSIGEFAHYHGFGYCH